MTRIEKIRLSHEEEWIKKLPHEKQMVVLRGENKQYELDWAPYIIKCKHPKYDPKKPWMLCTSIITAWRLPHARLIAYLEHKRTGRIVTIHDNDTDEIIK